MTVTDERAKQILFSSKIYNTPTRMVAKGSPLLPTPTSLKVSVSVYSRAQFKKLTLKPIGLQKV